VYPDDVPPPGVSLVWYRSGNLKLKAWISKPPDDGKKHPAIVYLHGGFAFGGSDWDAAKPYVAAGYVVMTPMLRGENGNPGYFEFFYGEVDDAIAAGRYLQQQPSVDPSKVFLSGHSVGGTISMLAAMLPSPYRAIATFGASPDEEVFFKWESQIVPFDATNQKEISLRSPIDHVVSIQKPLFVFVGTEDAAYYTASSELVGTALAQGKDCEFIPIDGDHFTSLEPAIRQSIHEFARAIVVPVQADTPGNTFNSTVNPFSIWVPTSWQHSSANLPSPFSKDRYDLFASPAPSHGFVPRVGIARILLLTMNDKSFLRANEQELQSHYHNVRELGKVTIAGHSVTYINYEDGKSHVSLTQAFVSTGGWGWVFSLVTAIHYDQPWGAIFLHMLETVHLH
jgi:dienelactone hydrolase